NNASERALRGPVVGRKNHYGSKSERGTQVAALLYSLCESAKLVDIDPRVYLRGAIWQTLRGEEVWLPHEVREKAGAGDGAERGVEGVACAALVVAPRP
ncbi:MAG: hypothetical protein IT374_07315, partial [Polyangiaceae bacterium]|nr:hypothetical protein [Polyangiaceae bacterium]